MQMLSVFAALLPVLVILVLLAWRKMPADIAGLIGWGIAAALACLYFHTALPVVLRASLSGIIASFPISLAVAFSILQVTLMQETGALNRVISTIKTVSPRNQVVQIMIINVGFGTLLTSLGALTVSILPPIMLALGYSTLVAIALPAIGYDALCTYALLGVPAVVLGATVDKIPGQHTNMVEVAGTFARYMPVISSCICLGMLWIVGQWKMVFKGLVPALLAGLTAGFIAIAMGKAGLVTLTGIAAGVGVMAAMLAYLVVTRQPLLDRSLLDDRDREIRSGMSLLAAISPWLLLVVFSLANAPFLPLYEWTFKKWAMPVTIIPGKPESLRVLWQAYFYILLSTALALPLIRARRDTVASTLRKWSKRAPRPVLAASVYFAIAYVCNHSGKDADWKLADQADNMVAVVATGSAALFGRFYSFVAPFLGLLGGFISGSETSSIAMFTNLHFSTAEKIGASGLVLAAASAIGGGLASVISPAKLQNAAASIDRIGEEGRVIRPMFVISLVITTVCAAMTLFWAWK